MNIDQSRAPRVRARGSTPGIAQFTPFLISYFLCPPIYSVMAITATRSRCRARALLMRELSPILPLPPPPRLKSTETTECLFFEISGTNDIPAHST